MGGFRLRVLNRDIQLSDGEYSIGRAVECDIPVQDGLVSRRHAMIRVSSGRASIMDAGSRNGTYLNGDRLSGERVLSHLDQIRVGEQEMMCIDEERVREQPPIRSCEACRATVEPHDAFCRKCGSTIRSAVAMHWDENNFGSSPPEDTTVAGGVMSQLGVLAGVAGRMLAAGNHVGAERVLEGTLLDLLQETIKSGERPEQLSVASQCALDLAEGLAKPRWLDWIFQIHEACAVVPSPGTIDRLTELLGQAKTRDARPIAKLLDQLGQQRELNPTDKFQIGRLQSLKKMCDPA